MPMTSALGVKAGESWEPAWPKYPGLREGQKKVTLVYRWMCPSLRYIERADM